MIDQANATLVSFKVDRCSTWRRPCCPACLVVSRPYIVFPPTDQLSRRRTSPTHLLVDGIFSERRETDPRIADTITMPTVQCSRRRLSVPRACRFAWMVPTRVASRDPNHAHLGDSWCRWRRWQRDRLSTHTHTHTHTRTAHGHVRQQRPINPIRHTSPPFRYAPFTARRRDSSVESGRVVARCELSISVTASRIVF